MEEGFQKVVSRVNPPPPSVSPLRCYSALEMQCSSTGRLARGKEVEALESPQKQILH